MAIAQSATSPSMSARDWSLLLLLGAIWGGSFFFARVAVAEVQPLMLVLLRVGIAAIALQLYLLVAGPSFAPALAKTVPFFGLALLNNVIPFSLIFAGQTQMGAGLASVLNATTPVWTLIIASLLSSDEMLTWNKVAGILLGIAGTAVMIGPGIVAGLGGPVWAKFALVGAALSYAFALLFARRFFVGVPAPLVAAGQLTASTIIMLPVVSGLYDPSPLLAVSSSVWAAVLALALLSTAFAYILFFRIVASAGATNASLVTLIVPASAVLLGAVFLGERLESFELAGMALIGLGLVTIDGRLFTRL
ncbi:MAG: DMT family transporter [Rhizobiaceae bacterium]|nr:DMT family transporter [Rhizobiaceae bacterium]